MSGYRPTPKDVPTQPAKPAEPTVPHWRLKTWFPDLSEGILNKLRQFHLELLEGNKTLNFLSQKTVMESDALHIADSIIGGRIVLAATKAHEIFDLGSGNGLPGFVMAILEPAQKFVIVEKDERKLDFLKGAVSRLQLQNVSIYTGRFDELKENSVEAAVSRDYANISKTILVARKPCKIGADYFHFKDESWVTEVTDIPSQVCIFWAPKLVKEYTLVSGKDPLAIVVTKKIG